jgi:ATP-dependent protease ClpP protease subunit
MYHANSTTLKKNSRKRKMEEAPLLEDDEEMPLPFIFPKMSSKNICSMNNNIYFNDDITNDSIFGLNRELRMMDDKLIALSLIHKTEPTPIYLYLTTNGGDVYAAFSAVDCIKSLRCPVYTVVDGFVASAGTLLSLSGTKRFIQPNAYMLFHELRSGMWGKMTDIDQEYCNLKKLMNHLVKFYTDNTSISKSQLEKLLKKDELWFRDECLKKGVVDEVVDF